MSNAETQGRKSLEPELRQGTQVLFRWAKWQSEQASGRPLRVAVFRKENARLVVHQYGQNLCGVLKLAQVKPKVRDFREWRKSFVTVQGKLVVRGWLLVSDSGEVSDVTH